MKCRRCGTEYDGEIRFGHPLPECPECGAKNFQHTPVHYKGKGFFSTDYMKDRKEANTKVVDKDA